MHILYLIKIYLLYIVNLSTAGQDDSSSEEAQSHPPSNGKPAVPPRPRSISIDHKRNGGIPGMIGSPMKGTTKPTNFEDVPCKDVNDVDSAESTLRYYAVKVHY